MKKFISLFLVFSILALSGNMFANEKRGADLIILRTDGTQVRGELIAVKQNSLLLMERESGADVTVEIVDTQAITIKKKSYVLEWTVASLLVGTGVGFMIGSSLESNDSSAWNLTEGIPTAAGTVIGSAIGLGAGLVVGLATKKSYPIQFEGKSDSEIKEILEELRKKARIKNV